MWTALFNGMSVGFAIGIILRTRRLWKPNDQCWTM